MNGAPDAALGREYAALREAAGLVALPERGLLRVTGPLRQKFLHGLLSHEVEDLAPGEGRRAALLDVKGHVLLLLRVLVARDAVVLECPVDRLELLERQLTRYRVGAPVRFEARPAALLAVVGPRTDAVLEAAGAPVPTAAGEAHVEGTLAGRPVRVARAGDLPGGGCVVHLETGDAESAERALRAAGAPLVGRPALDARRVEAGRAWFGVDVSEDNLLHETGAAHEYASFSKGCYVGQEVMARLDARGGHVSRQLRGLRLSVAAAAGVAVEAEGGEVGRVTTAAVSPRFGPVALAYVHRKHFEPGTSVTVAGAPARVIALPFPETSP